MSYIGNPPVVQSSRLVYEETATTAKTAFTPPGGYTVGQLEVYINGSQLMSDDFTATDGSTVNLTTACAVGDGFKSIAYGNFLASNAVNKSGDTMTGPLTLGGLLNTGATGQIKFPAVQNASADANTLDDYEEGTFTITLAGSTGNPTVGTIAANICAYTKVGKTVTVQGRYSASSISGGSGNLRLAGFPFVSAAVGTNVSWQTLTLGYRADQANNMGDAMMIQDNSSFVEFWTRSSTTDPRATVSSSTLLSAVGTTLEVYFSGTYLTS